MTTRLTPAERAAMDQVAMGAQANLQGVLDVTREALMTNDSAEVTITLAGYVEGLRDGAARGLLVAAILRLAAPEPAGQ